MQLPVHDYLDALGIPYTTGSFPPTTAKGAAEVAKAFGYAPRQIVKTLIFEVDTGEKVLVMVGGDQNAISGHLKKAIGSRNIKLASSDGPGDHRICHWFDSAIPLAATAVSHLYECGTLARGHPGSWHWDLGAGNFYSPGPCCASQSRHRRESHRCFTACLSCVASAQHR